ncbi:MAG: TrkH family potassium uptake protein [Clostridia bacterium]|nr:TrkH family potassium uptake protein [Clostridia bacterium]
MNYRMIGNMVGRLLLLEAGLLLLPALVSLIYREASLWALLAAAGVALLLGGALTALVRVRDKTIYAKEGFVIVSLSWILLSAVGALPFVLSGEMPSYVDALFETVSGFTTTGASVATDLYAFSHGVLFWRSFTHWIGGMGVLVLMMALIPTGTGRTIHVMRAEVPGPIVGKLVPRLRDTAKILYLIYLALTVVEIIALLCAGMPLFDSFIYTFGTAGTGGFGMHPDSVGSYGPAVQWIITVFMLLFGVNFNIYYLLLIRSFRPAFTSRELWLYLGVVLVSAGVITANVLPLYAGIDEALRQAVFQVSSIVTTTGFATTDFNLWPGLSKGILLLLMFMGGCAGSTAGGLKMSRVMLLGKTVVRELKRLVHPRSVGVVRLEGKRVEEETVHSTAAYFILYMALLAVAFLVLSAEPFSLETNLTAAITCLNNVGPGLGDVGPMGGFAAYSVLSKVVLTLTMLLGRLEIYPLVLALLPGTWTKE